MTSSTGNGAGGGGSGSGTLPYLGSKISLISYAGIRYEGVLFNINTRESTVGLSNVRSFGTEGRKPGAELPPCDDVFDFIVFRGKDIQDLTVTEPANHPQDPAIVAINPGPHMGLHDYTGRNSGGPFGGTFGGGMQHHHQQQQHQQHHQQQQHGHHIGGNAPMHHGGSPYQGNYSRRGRGRGGYAGGYNSRTIVGELRPQPNQTLKLQLEPAFDFEEGNRRFEKVAGGGIASASGASSGGAGGEGGSGTAENGKENDATGSPAQVPKGGYNRAVSFFDTISCEALDRQSGLDTRIDRQKQRVLDAATFGSSAGLPMRRGRGYRRTNYRRSNNQNNNSGTGGPPPPQLIMNSLPQVGFGGGGAGSATAAGNRGRF